MGWTFEEIDARWLQGARVLGLELEAIVEAFNRVELVFGREWIDSYGVGPGQVTRGAIPTLQVVSIGQGLGAVDGAPGADTLIANLRKRAIFAEAELAAISLIRRKSPAPLLELYPKVMIKGGERIPDFRIRRLGEAWTYVEVTNPNYSKAFHRVTNIFRRLTSAGLGIDGSFTLEVFLRREPTDQDLGELLGRIPDFCKRAGAQREELPDGLGILILNGSRPGEIRPESHPGEANLPRLGNAEAIVGPNGPLRHVVVRLPFSDQRAWAFLQEEARQLPGDAAGLVMVQMGLVPTGFADWETLLRKQFNSEKQTWVSAICLFAFALEPTARGQVWLPRTKLILNAHAKLALPSWLVDVLRDARAEFEKAVGI